MPSKFGKQIEKYFLLLLTTIFLILTFFIVKDIFALIIYSFLLAYFLNPLYNYFEEKIKNKSISSILTLSSSVFIFFIPFGFLSYFLILNLIKLIVKYQNYLENPQILNLVISEFISKLTNSNLLSNINFIPIINSLVSFIVDFSQNFFNSIPKTFFYMFITFFITYYILIYNKQIIRATNEYLPLSLKKQNEIIKKIAINIKVLFKGYFLTGIIQTIVAFIGYLIFGVDNLLIVTFLTLFASLIPYLGTPMIWVPVSIYLMINGNLNLGIGLLIYGTLIINLVDNFLRPYLMSNKESIPPALVFIGFIGGMIAFGIIGIILGPLIISITSILLKYLKEIYEN